MSRLSGFFISTLLRLLFWEFLLRVFSVIVIGPQNPITRVSLPGPSVADDFPVIINTADRIVGGADAALGQFPYIVSLRLTTGNHFCGGTIIHPSWIVTASHCTETLAPEEIVIVTGVTQLDQPGVAFACGAIRMHPGYNRQRLTNDIALIATTSEILFSEFVQPIPIARSYVGERAAALISGWGLLKYQDDDLATQLQFLETEIIGNDECRARHNILNRRFVYDNVICTYTHSNEGICLGDSGGPLVVQQVLVGVMSWVVPCGRGVPDAYARISAHYEWILGEIAAGSGVAGDLDPEAGPPTDVESNTLKFSPLAPSEVVEV